MLAYRRIGPPLGSEIVGRESHCKGGVKVGLGARFAALCYIVVVVSRWLWVVGLRRCARGKCMQRVANRTVMVVSRWVWVVGLRCCARGKCIQQIALESDRKQRFQKESRDFNGKVLRK